MKHVQNDQQAHTHLHGTQQNVKVAWIMQYDLEEFKSMYQKSIGGLMKIQQMCYYDQGRNLAKVGINHSLNILLVEIQDTKVIYEQDAILLMVRSIREYQHINVPNVLILF